MNKDRMVEAIRDGLRDQYIPRNVLLPYLDCEDGGSHAHIDGHVDLDRLAAFILERFNKPVNSTI